MPSHPHHGKLRDLRSSPHLLASEELLETGEGIYRQLVDHAPIGLMVLKSVAERTGLTFKIVAANQAVIAVTGLNDLEAADLPGKAISDVFPSIGTRDLDEALAELARSRKPYPIGQPQQEGTGKRTFSIQAFALPNRCVGLVFESLSERKRAEQALLQAAAELTRSNTELDQFAHAASHDLQEPLRTISSLTRLVVLDYSEKMDAQGIQYLSAVVESAKRMQALLDGLLKYSRVGAQRNPYELVNCEEVCDAAVADLRVAFEQSRAVLTRDPLPTVPGDRTQLIQLFQNLLANAIKFRGPHAPRIHVSAQQRDREWVLGVRDNGIGIDPQKVDQIFLLFHRLHSREEYPGTGIGLALCKKIVAQHGGRIWVESAPGAGSVFFFTLPAANLAPA